MLAKLSWYRLGGERSERQWSDVLGVIRAAAESLEVGYLTGHADGLTVRDLLDRALAEARSPSP